MLQLYQGVVALFSDGTTVKCGSPLLRVQSGARRFQIYASIAAACSLVGCHGTASPTLSNTSPQPAPVVQTVTNLSGIWVGAMPPSSDGRPVAIVTESSYVPLALLQIDSSDVHGSSGKLTLCSMHKVADAGSFSNAQLGKSAVELNGSNNSISLVKLSDDAGSLTVAFHSGSSLLAGLLHRDSESDFRAHCKI